MQWKLSHLSLKNRSKDRSHTMAKNNSIYRNLIMKKDYSAVVTAKTQKRSTASMTESTKTKSIDIKLDPIEVTYQFTDEFRFWRHPWTLQFLCKQYLCDFLSAYQQSNSQKVKCYAHVTKDTAKVYAEALVGIQHRQSNIQLPCQDATKATIKPRPILILCDGAGSAAVSDLGANALITQLTRLCQSLDPLLASYLDVPQHQDFSTLVRIIIRHAMGALQDCADLHRRSIRDFRSTLNLVIVGTEHTLWLKVGDGEIVQERIFQMATEHVQAEYQCLGTHNKGEFANQTQFIDDQLQFSDIHWGILNSKVTTGLALMSDGSAEKLISSQRDQVAGQITQWLQQLRTDQFKVVELYKRFYSEDFLTRSTGDDRSIALYSKSYIFN